jgi:iron complex transport system permease protein
MPASTESIPAIADHRTRAAVNRWGLARLSITLVVGVTGWAVIAAACLCVGSTTKGFAWPSNGLLRYRLEPVLLASLVGAALAAAGVVFQAILRNPLSDPYLLGVSSGASLASFLWRLSGTAAFTTIATALGEQVFSFAGAIISVAVVFVLASRRGRLEPVTLLLVGVIVNAVNGSLFLLVNELKHDITGGNEVSFLVGGIQTNLTGAQEWTAACCVFAGWVVLLWLSGQLNVAMLSEAEATALGVRIHRLRWTALVVASLVTAAVVAVSGPIGFVGLICPHLSRLIVGSDQRRLLPIATVMGAALLAVADASSRYLANAHLAQTLLPVGVLTGLLGGPFFLVLLWQSRRVGNRFQL